MQSRQGTIAAGDPHGNLHLWHLGTEQPKAISNRHVGRVRAVAFSPDGTIIASGGDDQAVAISGPDAGSPMHRLAGHRSPVYSLAFSSDGKIVASGEKDGTIRLWNVNDQEPICRLNGHKDSVLSLAFSPDGMKLSLGRLVQQLEDLGSHQ